MKVKKIIINESQLLEIEGDSFSYFDGDDNNHRGNSQITTSDDSEDLEYIKPITTDEYGKLLSPQNYFTYCNMVAYGRIPNNISETNKDLENKSFTIPIEILNNLKKIYSKIKDKNCDGKKRLSFLIKKPSLSIKELYRLNNYFQNNDEQTINIIGGDTMFKWVKRTIETAKESSKKGKELKKMVGIENAFIKPHNKTNGNGKKH